MLTWVEWGIHQPLSKICAWYEGVPLGKIVTLGEVIDWLTILLYRPENSVINKIVPSGGGNRSCTTPCSLYNKMMNKQHN